MNLPRYSKKHRVLFKAHPPIPWCNFFGLQYICSEFYNNTVEYDPEQHELDFVYTGNNYTALRKFLFD